MSPCKAKHIQMLKQIYKVAIYLLEARLFTIKVRNYSNLNCSHLNMLAAAISSPHLAFPISETNLSPWGFGVLGFWGIPGYF